MVNKCIAPGCRTGYTAESNHIKISVYRFPVEKELRQRWIQRVSCQNWIRQKNHFQTSDFQVERDDNTRGRGNKRGILKRKFLRPDAVPSILPNLPKYLSKELTIPRVTNARSESRKILEKARESKKLKSDSFKNLTELYEKFSLQKTECVVIKTDTQITFVRLNVDEKPSIKYSLKILENYLDYEMWCAELSIKKRHIQNIDFKPPGHITSFSTLCKILSLLEDPYKYKVREQFNEEDLAEEALELLKNPKLS